MVFSHCHCSNVYMYNCTQHNGFVEYLLWHKGDSTVVTTSGGISVNCMCGYCFGVCACQVRVSGINEHATKITGHKSHTWIDLRKRDHVTGISIHLRVCLYIVLRACVFKTYIVPLLIPRIKNLSIFLYCSWATSTYTAIQQRPVCRDSFVWFDFSLHECVIRKSIQHACVCFFVSVSTLTWRGW